MKGENVFRFTGIKNIPHVFSLYDCMEFSKSGWNSKIGTFVKLSKNVANDILQDFH